ncbi:hypothetical protein ACO2Q2_17435 [Dyella sp. KRB-257]|uniref:hypothetical protein n=1 Tax=Dyella sp. KRB-257 TaxID=3400915 RepID=UPI003C049DC2
MKLAIFRTKPHRFTGCTPLTAAERMARYSAAHAQRMQDRENAGAAPPKVRLVDGRQVLVALDGRPNTLPKDAKASA